LDYFKSAVQVGMTATPKRQDNIDTYGYFWDPVYEYSLKEGINDGFLTPYKVKRIQTKTSKLLMEKQRKIFMNSKILIRISSSLRGQNSSLKRS
jgi:type I restriction enzyme R subunit